MPSFVWNRDPSEAYDEPYEYGAQEQFAREAVAVLAGLNTAYAERNSFFGLGDRSAAKAVWMLQVDALSALADMISLLGQSRFRLASRLFRDVVETLDTSFYFALGGDSASPKLEKWYENEILSHRDVREFVKRRLSEEHASELLELYRDLSKYTHRSFRALEMSYLKGSGETSFYDGFRDNGGMLVSPQSISFAYAVSAGLIRRLMEYAVLTGELSRERTELIWLENLERDSVPRRFGTAQS